MRPDTLLQAVRDLSRHPERRAPLDDLARRAGRSRFQFHRAFRGLMQETPRGFLERLRLEQAAARLRGPRASILQVARATGFASPEVFARAFRRRFGCTPRQYRAAAAPLSAPVANRHRALTASVGPCLHLYHLSLQPPTRKPTMPMLSVTRTHFAGQPVLLIRRSIPRSQLQGMLSECFGRLFGHGHAAGLAIAGPPVARYMSVGPGLWTVEAAMPLAAAAPGDGDMEAGTLPAGPAALAVHGGAYDTLADTYAAIEKWMADHGAKPGGAPWESYVTDPGQFPDPADWRTEVYWPLQE